jgi:hypothetical protein
MRVLPDFQRSCHKRGLFAASSLLLLLAAQTFAQSGRRAPKPTQTPVTAPDTENKQPQIADGRELMQKHSLIVAKQVSSKHLLSEDAIFSHFMKRLSEFNNATVIQGGNLQHDAAVKRAKSETEKVVVLVQFDVDEFQHGTLILNSPDLDVGGPMLKQDNWPAGTPIRITTEAVGIEAAEQVRDWLIVDERKIKNP